MGIWSWWRWITGWKALSIRKRGSSADWGGEDGLQADVDGTEEGWEWWSGCQ